MNLSKKLKRFFHKCNKGIASITYVIVITLSYYLVPYFLGYTLYYTFIDLNITRIMLGMVQSIFYLYINKQVRGADI